MKAYVIAAETVNDQVMFVAYAKEVPRTLGPFGGKCITRGGNFTRLESEWPNARLVIIEFPSRADAEAWYTSDIYQEIVGLRHKSSVGNLVIADEAAPLP